ncbi:MAG: autotransporter-associated beta strand repeat-containing protein [Burkholderiaceae bacterium]|nr:autotransporter-associated beta strand repeat-containing protein [Burkholderiaceae bacterium]
MRSSAGSIDGLRRRWRPRHTSLAAALLLAGPAWALPQGGVGTSGGVSWQQTAPGQLQITQSTPRAAIDWQQFSIAAGEQLRIAQPDAAAILFNRVTGADPSLILGRLQANGRVFLSNPRGVIFGAGSQVDVGGLVATTLRLDGTSLAQGRWRLHGDAASSGELRAEGEIRAPGGTVALIAPSLSVGGSITAARLGLAAVQSVEVDVDGDGLIFFNARADDLDARLRLLPSARLQAGSAELRARARAGFADTVLNLDGVVRAQGLALRDGQVVVDGGSAGITRVAGELQADGAGGLRGGEITVLGQDLLVESGARLEASGALGGGQLRLGGDFQGRLAGLYPHARQLLVRPGAQLLADATQSGDGGLVVLWSAQATRFGGQASARGGLLGGDGGLVEVSSAGWLDFRGQVDLRAGPAGGRAGTLLLDPKTLEIGSTANLNGDATTGDDLAAATLAAGDQSGLDSKITAAKVSQLLGTASVSLAATDAISVLAAISAGAGDTPGSLSLTATGASGSISIERSITLRGASSTLTLSAATLNLGATGQSLTLTAAGGLQLPSSRTLNVASGASVDIAAPLSGTALTKAGAGTLQLSAANTYSGGTTVSAGTLKAGVATAWTVATPEDPSVLASGPFGLGQVTVSSGASVDLAGFAVDNAWRLAGQGLADAGALHSSSGAASSTGALTLASGAEVGLGAASGASLSLSGVIASDPANAARGLAKHGDGVLSLSGANTYTGGTTVLAGTLVAARSSSLDEQQQLQSGALGTGRVTLEAGSTLQLNAALLHNTLRLEGDASLVNAAAAQLAGAIDEGASPARLSKSGAGLLTLSAANSYSGGTTVEAGGLVAGRASSSTAGVLSDGPFGLGRVDVAKGASVDLAGFVVDNAWQLTGLGLNDAGALHSSTGSGGASAGALSLQWLADPDGSSEAGLGAASGATLTLSGAVTDAGGTEVMKLVKLGTGSVVLSGAAAPGLGSRIDAGTLQVGAGGSSGSLTGAVQIDQGATLAFARSSALTVASLISGAGRLQQSGTAALTLSGANTYAGGTAVDGGSLVAGRASSSTAGVLSSGPFGLGRVDVAKGASVDLAGFVVDNAWQLTGLGLNDVGALHSSTGSGGASAGALSLQWLADPDGSSEAGLGAASGATLTLSGAVTDAGGTELMTLVKLGTGKVVLSGAAAPGLGSRIDAGTLQVGAGGSSGSLTGAVQIDLGATLAFARSSALTVASLISGDGRLQQSGTAALTLSGANTYAGGTAVDGGSLVAGRASSSTAGVLSSGPFGVGRVDVASGASVDLAGFGVDNDWRLSGLGLNGAGALRSSSGAGGASAGDIALAASTAIGVATDATLSLSGAIVDAASGAAALALRGGGLLKLSAAAAPGAGTTLEAGTLQLRDGAGGAGGELGGAIRIETGATLELLRSSNLSLAGALSGDGSLVQGGSGRVTLAHSLGFGGQLRLAAGSLLLSGANALLDLDTLTLQGGELDLGGSGLHQASTLQLQGGSLVHGELQAGAVQAQSGSVAAVLKGGFELVKTGTGLLTLSGANTYSGGTSVQAGTLQLGADSSGSAGALTAGPLGTGTVQISATAVVELDGHAVDNAWLLSDSAQLRNSQGQARSAGSLGLADQSSLSVGNSALQPEDEAAVRLSLAGTLDASSGLRKLGGGRLVLTGNASVSGGTTLAAGVLQLGDGTALGGGMLSGDIANSGLLVFQRAADVVFAGRISGSGALQQAGSGMLTLTADHSHSGGTTVAAGTLRLGNGGSSGQVAGDIDLAAGTRLVLQRSDALQLSAVIRGDGALEQQGSGRLTLSGANSFGGGLQVLAGELVAGSSSSGAAGQLQSGPFGTGTVQVAAGAGVDLAGQRVDNAWRLAGSGLAGAGALRNGLAGSSASSDGELLLDGAVSLGRAATAQLSLGGVIADADAGAAGLLSVVGDGLLRLSAANPFAGGLDVAAGRVQAGRASSGNAGALASSPLGLGQVVVHDGAAVDLAGFRIDNAWSLAGLGDDGLGALRSSSGAARSSGQVALQADVGLGASAGASLRLDADLVDQSMNDSTLSVLGTGELVLAGDSGHRGGTAIGAGTLRLGVGGSSGSVMGDIANAGRLVFQRSDDWVFAERISGSGSVEQAGSGRLSFSANHSYSGGTTISAGTLRLGVGGGSGSVTGNIANQGALVFQRSDNLGFGGVISGSGRVEQAGTARLTFTANHSYSGGTTISAGTLRLGNGGTAGSVAGDIANQGALVFQRSNDWVYAGAISGSGRVEQAGSGRLTLTANHSHSGGTAISAGTLRLGNGGTAGSVVGDIANEGALVFQRSDDWVYAGAISGSGRVEQAGSGRLSFSADHSYGGGTTISAGTLRLGTGGVTGSVLGDIVNNGSLVFQRSDDRVFGSLISGSGGVEQAGSGQLSFIGQQSYSGGTRIRAGTLRLGQGGTAGGVVGDLHIDAAGSLVFQRSDDLVFGGAISGSGRLEQAGSGMLSLGADQRGSGPTRISSGTLRLVDGSGSTTLGGDIGNDGLLIVERSQDLTLTGDLSGSGRLQKSGSGVLSLSGTATPGGGTTVSAGVLRLVDADGGGGGGGSLAGALSLDSGAALVFQRSGDLTHAGLIGGAGRVEQAGSGRLTLTADQGYGGGTTISAGTLRLGDGGAAGSVSGNIANQGLLVFEHGSDRVFGGVISGSGRVEQAGTARLTFTANHSYSGGTTISAGTLRLGNGGTAGSVAGDIVNDGVLVFQRSDNLGFGGVISGSGRVEQAGTARLSFTANHSYSGGTSISAGTLRLGNGGTAGSVLGDIANHGALVFQRSDDWVYAGTISGSGRVEQAGSGRLILSANHSHSGGTSISAGTLQLGNGGSTGSVAGDIANEGALVFQRSDDWVYAGLISGSGRVEQAGGGRLTFTAGHSYGGGTRISAGTLQLGTGGVTGSVLGDITNHGALVFQRSDDWVFGGQISGSGRVEQAGSGRLSFSADHLYSGGTTVSAGSLALGLGGSQGGLIGDVQLAAGSLLLVQRSDALSLGGAISGAGALWLSGGGSLTLAGTSGFAGGTRVIAGRLIAGRDSRNGPGAALLDGPFGRGAVVVEAGAEVDLAGHRVDNDWRLAGGLLRNSLGDAASAGALDLQAATELNVADGATLSLQGASQGTGALHKRGAGRLLLAGDSLRSGATEIEQGQLAISGGVDRSGSGALRVAAGASLDLGDGAELTRPLQLDGGSLVNSRGTARISGSGLLLGADSVVDRQGLGLTLAAPLDDGGSGAGLRLIGNGQLVLAADGSLSGGLSLEAGSLVLASASALSGSSLVLAAGTTLSLAASSRIAGLDGAGQVALGTHTLTLGDAADHRLSGGISGAGGLIKQGSGALELAGPLNYSGPTQVAAGSLLLASGSTLAGGAVSLAGDASVLLQLRSDQSWASLNGLGGNSGSGATLQLLDGARLSIGSDGSDSRFAGSIVGDGGLSKLGAGTLSLAGSVGHSGATRVEQGRLVLESASAGSAASAYRLEGAATLQLLADSQLGALSGAAGSQVLLGGTLSLLGLGGDQLLASNLSGAGGLVKQGDNRLTLSGDNRYQGATAVLGGTLAIAADAALGLAPAQATPGQLLLDGGRLQWLGAAGGRSSLAATRGIAIGPGGAQLQLAAGHQLDLPATLSDAQAAGLPAGLVVAGAGMLRLAAANSRAGATRVEGGATLVLAAEVGEAALGPAPLLASPQHLQLDGGTLRSEASLSLAATRGLSLGAGGGQLEVAAGSTLTLGAALAETPELVDLGTQGLRSAADGLLHIRGGGQVLLAEGDSSRLGPTRVSGGSLLALHSDGALGQAPAQAQAGWLQLDGGGLRVLADLALAPSRGLSIGSGGALLDIAAGQRLTLAGALDDAAGLTGSGNTPYGTLTLAGGGLLWADAAMTSQRGGATEIRGGTGFSLLRDDQLGQLPGRDGRDAAALRLDGGRLLWRDSATLAAGRGLAIGASGATLDLAEGVTLTLAGALSAWTDATPDTSAATLAQALLHQTGAGSLVLAGATPASHAGHLTVSGGRLVLDRDDQLGSLAGRDAATPALLTLDGGTLQTSADLDLAAARRLQLGAAGGTLDVQAGTLRLDGDIVERDAAAARLVKTGAGSLALAGASQHRGGTEVRAGLLQTLAAERLADSGSLQLGAGARLLLGGDETLAGLADLADPAGGASSQIDLSRHQLRLQQDGDSRYSGRWLAQDGAALVKDGSGTLDLAGALSGAARVAVLGGTLGVVAAGTLDGGTALAVARGATLRLDQTARIATLDLAGTLAGSGAGLQVEAAARLDSATLQLPLSAATLHSSGDVSASAPLRIAGEASLGAGRFTLAPGASLEAERLQLSGGQLQALDGRGGQLGAAMQVQLTAATLQLAGPERLASLQAGDGARLLPLADAGVGVAGGAGAARLDLSGSLVLAGSELLLPLSALDLLASGSQRLAAPLQLATAATLRDGQFLLAPGGRLAAPSLLLQSGLLLTHDDQALAGTAALGVASGATLALGGADRVQTLDLQGRLRATTAAERETAAPEATPRLSASQSVRLDGARVELALDTPRLDSLGETRLDAAVQVGELATLQSGRLSLGADATAWLQTPRLQVLAGELFTLGSGQLRGPEGSPGPALSLAAGSRWWLAGDERLGWLDDGTAAVAAGTALARIELGAATLTLDIGATAPGGGDGAGSAISAFSGVLAGSGSLVKQGAGLLRLTAAQAHGATRIEAGTLQLGAGGTAAGDDQARLGSGAVLNHGTLRIARAGTLVLDQALSGSGSLVLDGPGTVQLAAAATHGGGTELRQGRLQTLGAERLPDAGAVQVAAGASLELGGDETLGRLSLAAGAPLSLGGSLIATQGDLLLGGPVRVATARPILLSAAGQRIEALDDGNRWGSQPLSLLAGQLRLSAGVIDGVVQDLVLGSVVLGAASTPSAAALVQASATPDATGDGASDSLIQAGRLSLAASGLAAGSAAPGLQLLGGTLALRALAPARYSPLPPLDGGGLALDPLRGRVIQLAQDVISQQAGATLVTAAGSRLSLQAPGGGSITLADTGNRFDGPVQALSGAGYGSAWTASELPGSREVGQSRISLAGEVLNIGGAGLEADMVRLAAGRLATTEGSVIAARLWYNDSAQGLQNSAPGLQITLLPAAFGSAQAFGSSDAPINTNVGGRSLGQRSEGLGAGFVQLLPRNGASGTTVVFLAGPSQGEAGYGFFHDGAGSQGELPLFYNGVLPATPQLSGSLSAVAATSESARRERFEEVVRTENVAIRLRAGVIAEVGPGRAATQGSEGLRRAPSCEAAPLRLDCVAPAAR